jgi:hypothetical protein
MAFFFKSQIIGFAFCHQKSVFLKAFLAFGSALAISGRGFR